MSRSYLPRLVDDQLARGLRSAGAVVLEGPKACGKTTTAGEQAATVVRLDTSPQLRAAALADPSVLLAGETPRSNGDFQNYWTWHLDQERQRVHESRYLDGALPRAA